MMRGHFGNIERMCIKRNSKSTLRKVIAIIDISGKTIDFHRKEGDKWECPRCHVEIENLRNFRTHVLKCLPNNNMVDTQITISKKRKIDKLEENATKENTPSDSLIQMETIEIQDAETTPTPVFEKQVTS
jgi:hypothetical protein